MHEKMPGNLEQTLVDKEQLYQWLKFGDLKGGTKKINCW
jgi:hypothetical protein